MSSFIGSLELTAKLATALPQKVTPAFGIHPWFCHALYVGEAAPERISHYRALFTRSEAGVEAAHPELTDALLAALPPLLSLDSHLASLRGHLSRWPTAVVGEIGVDRSFRIPKLDEGSSSAADKRRLTSIRTPVSHQLAVFEAQLDVAVELGRNASVHAVQGQGELEAVLKRLDEKWGERFTGPQRQTRKERAEAKNNRRSGTAPTQSPRGIHIDIHSPLISTQTLTNLHRRYPNSLFFSFSTTICGRSPRLNDLISATPDDRLLIESDWNGPEGMEGAMWEVLGRVCEAKAWRQDEAVERLAANWRRFMWEEEAPAVPP